MMERVLAKEMLDFLPPDSPEALGSRRDLTWINTLMKNASIAARAIRRAVPAKRFITMADIGGGDGRISMQVARILGRRNCELRAQIIDQQEVVATAVAHPSSITAVRADVFSWAANVEPCFDIILANLFLHHFAGDQLQCLFDLLKRRTIAFIAVEPERTSFSLLLTRGLGLLGCNHVTRHDAAVSVRAGFRGSELSSLWASSASWKVQESRAGIASHLFVAKKL